MSQAKTTGLDELRRSFRRIVSDAPRISASAARKGADTVASEIRSHEPPGHKVTVEVHQVKTRDKRVRFEAEVEADGILRIEYGGTGQTPHPFVRRSFDSKESAVASQIARDIRAGVEKIAGS